MGRIAKALPFLRQIEEAEEMQDLVDVNMLNDATMRTTMRSTPSESVNDETKDAHIARTDCVLLALDLRQR